jgi:NAD(P)H-nitrite reductase large subunit
MTNRIKVLNVELFSIGQIQAIDASTRLYEVQQDDSYRGLACHDGQVVGAALYGDMQLMGPLREAVEQGKRLQEIAELFAYFPGLQKTAG